MSLWWRMNCHSHTRTMPRAMLRAAIAATASLRGKTKEPGLQEAFQFSFPAQYGFQRDDPVLLQTVEEGDTWWLHTILSVTNFGPFVKVGINPGGWGQLMLFMTSITSYGDMNREGGQKPGQLSDFKCIQIIISMMAVLSSAGDLACSL